MIMIEVTSCQTVQFFNISQCSRNYSSRLLVNIILVHILVQFVSFALHICAI